VTGSFVSKRLLALLIAVVGGGILAGLPVAILRGISAQAMTCNIIPRAVKLLRSEQGLVDRPVAGPGDTVTVTADLGCDTSLAKPGFSRSAAQNVVTLEFQGPDGLASPPSVAATVLRVLDCEDPTVVADARCNTLQFTMPDTSAVAAGLGLEVLAGPARIRVQDGATRVGSIYELFQPSLGCGDLAADPSFGKFTVLPPANVLPTPGAGGAGTIPELVGALDGNGNAVFRFHVGDALVAPPGDPVATIIEYEAPFLSLIPSQEFLLTYNAFGQRIPPLLRLTDTKTMLGTIDVPEGLMQVAQSVGTTSIPVDFAALVEADDTAEQRRVGPIRLPTTSATPPGPLAFRIVAATPLVALRSSVGTVAIGADEELLGERNQDGDTPVPIDLVAELTDLATGEHTETRMALGEFSFSAPQPALAVDGDLVAFLQSEDASGASDLNLDGDALDQIFRAFDSGQNLTPGPLPAQTSADPGPVVDGRQLAISDRFVFFRTAEADEPPARRVWERGTGSGTLKSGKVDGKFRFAAGEEDVPGVDYADATTARDPGKFSGVKLECGAGGTATLSGNWLAPGSRPRFNATVVTGACTTSGTCPQGTITCEGALSVPSANPPLPPELAALRFRATFEVGPLAAGKRSFTTSFSFSALTGPGGLESLNGDADALDTVLQSFDAAGATLQPEARSAASRVATAAGRALFLTPEAEQGNASLNADTDAADEVAQLYDGPSATLVNLRRAASDVALSPDVACVAVSEAGEQADLDLDGNQDDAVLFAGTPAGLLGGAPLENTGIAVTKLGALGTRCVALVPDAGGDVLVLYDHATRGVVNTGQAAEDFVLGPERALVAFRTPEAQQATDLNRDGDLGDSVMQVWKILDSLLVNTERQAIPCDVAGCEAFQLGTIVGSTLTFLGTEAGQAVGAGCLPQSPAGGCDLDGDGDGDGTVVHTVTLGDTVSFAVIPFNGDLDATCVPFAEVFAGGVKICECLTECDAAQQACSPLRNPDRFGGEPLSVVPELGCEEQHDIDSNGVLDCRAEKVFCDVDGDGDGVFNQIDTCPVDPDAGQTDLDTDLLGDACDPDDESVPPCELDCNVNGDSYEDASLIDQRDIELIFAAVGTNAQGFAACGDRRDRDQDRLITILDAAACVEQCTFEDCAEPDE
jgi:hypothetical protein